MGFSQHGTGALLRPCFFLALALMASGTEARPAGRMRPPPGVTCTGGSLTSYFGRVVGYKRSAISTWLKIATDYGTVEEVTAPNDRFLYRGAAFAAKDLARIEAKPGVLRRGTRATAWVCEGGTEPPLVDWNGAAE
jgi:hypothetical protein